MEQLEEGQKRMRCKVNTLFCYLDTAFKNEMCTPEPNEKREKLLNSQWDITKLGMQIEPLAIDENLEGENMCTFESGGHAVGYLFSLKSWIGGSWNPTKSSWKKDGTECADTESDQPMDVGKSMATLDQDQRCSTSLGTMLIDYTSLLRRTSIGNGEVCKNGKNAGGFDLW